MKITNSLIFNWIQIKFMILTFLFIIGCEKNEDQIKNETFQLNLIIEGEGTLSLPSGTYDANSSLTVTATPSDGYYFDQWIGLEEKIETLSITITLNQNRELTAIFLPIPELSPEVVQFIPKKIDTLPVFMIENGGKIAYLTDKTGTKLKVWNFDSKLGNDIELLPDGSIMALFKPDNISIPFGGYGGILRKIDDTGNILWEYELNTEYELLHHDFLIMPNGNVLVMVWEKIFGQEYDALGYSGSGPVVIEKIIEIDPTTNNIVWQWRMADHTIQEFNSDKENYGPVAEYPQKIDINYIVRDDGDLTHANGIYYDQNRDLIYLSVNFFSEVWVIPHNYSTEETATELGDLRFRFGNPQAYKGQGERLFFSNHHPTLVEFDPETKGNFLIYMNGTKDEQSIVYEFSFPQNFDTNPLNWTTPQVVWSFTNTDLYNGKISGAYRLPNGNTLICEGDFGYWEVNREGQILWKYKNEETTFWRGYVYP